MSNYPPLLLLLFFEANFCFISKFILSLSFSQETPLIFSAANGHLEVTRLLVESQADVAARDRCFSPPPSHHLPLTICLAAMAKLHSNGPSNATKPTLLHTCAASARRNDALPRLLRPCLLINAVPLRAAAAVWQSPLPLAVAGAGLGARDCT